MVRCQVGPLPYSIVPTFIIIYIFFPGHLCYKLTTVHKGGAVSWFSILFHRYVYPSGYYLNFFSVLLTSSFILREPKSFLLSCLDIF